MAKKTGVVLGDDNIQFNEKKSLKNEKSVKASSVQASLDVDETIDVILQSKYQIAFNKETKPFHDTLNRLFSTKYHCSQAHALNLYDDLLILMKGEVQSVADIIEIADLHYCKVSDSYINDKKLAGMYLGEYIFFKGIELGLGVVHTIGKENYLQIGYKVPNKQHKSNSFPFVIREAYYQLNNERGFFL